MARSARNAPPAAPKPFMISCRSLGAVPRPRRPRPAPRLHHTDSTRATREARSSMRGQAWRSTPSLMIRRPPPPARSTIAARRRRIDVGSASTARATLSSSSERSPREWTPHQHLAVARLTSERRRPSAADLGCRIIHPGVNCAGASTAASARSARAAAPSLRPRRVASAPSAARRSRVCYASARPSVWSSSGRRARRAVRCARLRRSSGRAAAARSSCVSARWRCARSACSGSRCRDGTR